MMPMARWLCLLRIQKTQKESIHPISPEMLALCGERDKGIVFKGFNRSMTQEPLKKWLKAAGITKRMVCRFKSTTIKKHIMRFLNGLNHRRSRFAPIKMIKPQRTVVLT